MIPGLAPIHMQTSKWRADVEAGGGPVEGLWRSHSVAKQTLGCSGWKECRAASVVSVHLSVPFKLSIL